MYNVGVGLGGSIVKDRLWFFTSHMAEASTAQFAGIYFNKTQDTLFYTPDLSRPGTFDKYVRDSGIRFTWQATAKQRVAVSLNRQDYCWCNYGLGPQFAPEATWIFRIHPNNLEMATWTYPATSRLLLEGGVVVKPNRPISGVQDYTGNARSVVELSMGLQYGSFFGPGAPGSNTDYGRYSTDAWGTRVAMSYVTGSHAFKTGMQTQSGRTTTYFNPISNVQYTFLNQVPVSLTEMAAPHYQNQREKLDLGLYAQDQWTIRKLTLNLGVRYDHINSYVPAQTKPATIFTPAFSFDQIENTPNWNDVEPRLGVAYDLFGNGKTALKASVGRYVVYHTTGLAKSINPAGAVASLTMRTWNDLNRNYVPDCDLTLTVPNGECGPVANRLFGTTTIQTHFASDVTEGWFVRPYDWQVSASLQHELRPGVGLTVSYFRTWFGNFAVSGSSLASYLKDNRALQPGDLNPYCVTAPVDSRLPSGGGYQLCQGLYDVTPSKFGQVDNLVTNENIKDRSQAYNGIEAQINARFGKGGLFSGGVSTGQTVTNNCPQRLPSDQFCKITLPWTAQTQIKFSFAYPLPWWGLQASTTFQNLPGFPIAATYAATNAQIAPSLGRNLAACGAAVTCTATATIQLIEPNTRFEDRYTLLDLRVSKSVRVGRVRLQPRIDVYNLLNSSGILNENTRFGPSWLQPTEILEARFAKFGVNIDF